MAQRDAVLEPVGTESERTQKESSDPLSFARSYQVEAWEQGMKQNTIVFLETGSGKTLIASMLLRSYAAVLRKPSPFVAVFLVPKDVLVSQQAKALEKDTGLKVGTYSGGTQTDFWNSNMWKQAIEKNEVLVMTPEILLNSLRHAFFKFSVIKGLVFDECHHARGNHPYALIMKVYTCVSESVLAEFIPFPTLTFKFYEQMDSQHPFSTNLADQLRILREQYELSLNNLDLDENDTESIRKDLLKGSSALIYCLDKLGIWLAMKVSFRECS
ncbi:Endoribonuclease Dicer-2-like protein [Morus notabilis]|uniref:Endoribonuclease Dicer-2-like protein n=1 Tax=Morus notabilis TaxID=981085 RepID=W9R1L2_9ROSA|nr:Endoribonuclease Dicer-2-like protein [Morus notabilis]